MSALTLVDGAFHQWNRRGHLAIIGTYDELCGIAGYTRALERQLQPHADVEVPDLDQHLLRSPHKRVQRLDLHIIDGKKTQRVRQRQYTA